MSSLLDEEQNYYEILEVKKDSSPAEIRSAYMRARSSWKKDNVAFYSIFSEADTERLLRRIEEAYQTLSHPERRREYDRKNGFAPPPPSGRSENSGIFSLTGKAKTTSGPLHSLDPPMEGGGSEADLLIPPSTDFAPAPMQPQSQRVVDSEPSSSSFQADSAGRRSPLLESIARGGGMNPSPTEATDPMSSSPPPHPADEQWRGQTLRRARESQGITLEELAAHTKISKSYITAIEEEHFEKLPAPVFLRGFLITIARRLRLPQEQVSSAWMNRIGTGRSN